MTSKFTKTDGAEIEIIWEVHMVVNKVRLGVKFVITLSDIDRFSKFSKLAHSAANLQEMIIKDSITPQMHRLKPSLIPVFHGVNVSF